MNTRPVADILAGLEVDELEAGDTPLEAIVVIKVLPANTDEGTTWAYRSTSGLTNVEEVGALTLALDSARAAGALYDE